MKPRAAVLRLILALSVLAAPGPSHGQQSGKVYRIGFLGGAAANTTPQQCPISWSGWQALLEGLREHGYIQGQNLVIECRMTGARDERAPALAAELVSLKPDLLIVFSTANVRAVKQATNTLPIVMLEVWDPVGTGLVASLAHPGGNVTGLAEMVGMQIVGKRLQLLKEALPTVSRVAVLGYSGNRAFYQRETEPAARVLGLTLQFYEVREPEELEGAFTAMTKARAEALFVQSHTFTWVHGQRIADLAAQSRLPAVYPFKETVQAGGLLAYDVNRLEIWRRAGFYVDKIFNGTKPADLPVEQPTKFELVINLKTAKALGLTIPQSLLSRADEVIQ